MNSSDPSSSGAFSSALGRSDPVASADDTTAALLSINGLSYVATDTSLSVVQSRTHKRFDSTRPTHVAGDMLSFTLNTGNQFLNARTSFITFEVRATCAAATEFATFGEYCSVLNLIGEYAFTHSSGVELERIRDANSWYNCKETWSTTAERWGREAHLWGGLGVNANGSTNQTPFGVSTVDGGYVKFVVPLYLLSDMWDQNILCPPYLVAGSRLDLQLAPDAQAFQTSGATTVAYAMRKAQIHLDLYTVTDGVMRSITAISSTSGLDIDYTSMWDTQQYTALESSPTISVNKAISMAQAVHCFVRPQPYQTDFAHNSFVSINMGRLIDAQVVLGSMFLPLQGMSGYKEAYAHLIQYWGVWANRHSTGTLDMESFTKPSTSSVIATTVKTQAPETVNRALLTQMLERSQILASGTAISSQRNMQFSYRLRDVLPDPPYSEVEEGNRITSLYTQYAKLVSIFLDSAIVRS